MHRHLAAALLVVLVPLSACGDDATPSSPEAAVTPSSPAAAATPSESSAQGASITDARAEYLRLLEPSGRSAGELSAVLDDPQADLARAQQAVDEYAQATEQFAAALEARDWPDEVAGPIADLAAQLRAQVEPARAAARGTSVDEIRMLLSRVPGAFAAEQVRDAFQAAGA